jgi:hypothetical protein
MAQPPADPPDVAEDDDRVEPPALLTAERTSPSASPVPSVTEKALARDREEGEPTVFRARATRAQIALNVAVGAVLTCLVGAFLCSITLDRPWLGVGGGALLALLGARHRREPDELTPLTIHPAPDRSRAIELRFEGAPAMRVDHASALHVDAEATGDSREGYTHWIVLRREGEKPSRVRARSREEAVVVSKRLRVILEVPPLHPLGDDELGGDDWPADRPRGDETAPTRRRRRPPADEANRPNDPVTGEVATAADEASTDTPRDGGPIHQTDGGDPGTTSGQGTEPLRAHATDPDAEPSSSREAT